MFLPLVLNGVTFPHSIFFEPEEQVAAVAERYILCISCTVSLSGDPADGLSHPGHLMTNGHFSMGTSHCAHMSSLVHKLHWLPSLVHKLH